MRALLAVFVGLPIWLYLLHEVLERVHASELMWFLYWVYIPVNILLVCIGSVLDES